MKDDFGLINSKGLSASDLLYIIQEGHTESDAPVKATTPHGSYTFNISEAIVEEDGSIMLRLKEIARRE